MIEAWILQYEAFMQAHGYVQHSVRRRLKYLHCLDHFLHSQGLSSLEQFGPGHLARFIDYWVEHHPQAKPSQGFKRPTRFQPHHHIHLQYTLRAFLRWAYSEGLLQADPFPLRVPRRGPYFFPATLDYLHFCQVHKGLAQASWLQIELFCRRFDRFLHQHQLRDFNQLDAHHLDGFVRQQAAGNIPRIQRVHKILRGFLGYLFSRGLVQRDWAAALISPRQYQLARTPRALNAAQVLHLLRSIDRRDRGGKRDFAVILLAATLGVRASEIAHLRLEDLDWKRQSVRFQQSKNRNLLHLPLSRPLIEALLDYVQQERPPHSPYRQVFLRLCAPRTPLHPASVSGLMARRMRQAEIPGSGHQLRHAFASELLRLGIAYSTLQELLGHRHLTSTQIYTKIDLRQLREVADNDADAY